MRLAWFSPWPPDRSGIAGRSADVVPRLAARGHAIDVIVDERRIPVPRSSSTGGPEAGHLRLLGAHEFVWRVERGQYDLPIYQMGNSRLHEYIWPYLLRWPGLTVLHDAHLHHARARALLSQHRPEAYRAEFAWSHPGAMADAAELAIAGFGGAYYYQWPMLRGVLAASRLVATHALDALDDEEVRAGSAPVEHITLGEGDTTRAAAGPDARHDRRHAAGMTPDHVVFGGFGALSPHRRIEPIVRAFAGVHAAMPGTRLVLAGTRDPAVDLDTVINALGLAGAVLVVDDPDDDTFDGWIAAADVSLNLRWPTAREVSGPWLRAMAAGRATIIVDLQQNASWPTIDPRTWTRHQPRDARDTAAPIAVAIDILDEAHSLRRAMLGLAAGSRLRDAIGSAARAFWESRHTIGHMVADYERAIARALETRPPARPLPAFLRPDPLAPVRTLLDGFGPATAARLEPLHHPGSRT
jgi:glycosyltransferase involved in cell wall biosynthesis